MSLESWPFGLPAPRRSVPPDGQPPERGLILLGALTMYLTVFLTLIAHGQPPQEAVTVTIALAMGGATAARRLLGGNDDDREGPR